jgi:hypothetical protein
VRVSEGTGDLGAEVVFPISVDVSFADALASECGILEVPEARVVSLE